MEGRAKKNSEQFSQGLPLLEGLDVPCHCQLMGLLLLVWALFLLCGWEVVLDLHGKGFVAGGS